jgi:formylglycine-generating enzyme required for sulfatase activity
MTVNQTEVALPCPRCGSEVQTSWNFCPHCSLALEVPAGERATLSDRIRYIRRDSQTRSRRQVIYRWILTVSTVMTVLIIVGGGIILFHPAFVPSLFEPGEPLVVEKTIRAVPPQIPELPAAAVTKFYWVRIPAGTVRVGEPGNTTPVELDAFEIMKYEVTNQQWWHYLFDEQDRLRRKQLFARAVPRNWDWDPHSDEFPSVPLGLHDKPVVYINWYQANDFCSVYLRRKLQCPETYLPSSAQWEMAARGTKDERRYPWGDEPTIDRGGIIELRCNVRETGLRRPVDVTEFPKDLSPFGVFGMAGNVSEFVGYAPTGHMAYRGGSFDDAVIDAQIHFETVLTPRSTFSWSYVGFRAARQPVEE